MQALGEHMNSTQNVPARLVNHTLDLLTVRQKKTKYTCAIWGLRGSKLQHIPRMLN